MQEILNCTEHLLVSANHCLTVCSVTVKQGIVDCKLTEDRQIFSRMFVMAKEIKEWFASTLIRIL